MSEDQAAEIIQGAFRSHSFRRKHRAKDAAATKIQAFHRGARARRDMDTRSSGSKTVDSQRLSANLQAINNRMTAMAKEMEVYEMNQDEKLLRAAKANGARFTKDIVGELEDKKQSGHRRRKPV
jgi:hypothetical protein